MKIYTVQSAATGTIDKNLDYARRQRSQDKRLGDTKGIEYWTEQIECLLLVRDLKKNGVIAKEIEIHG